MKTKLIAVLAVLIMIPANAAEAKPDNQKVPRWMVKEWAIGKRCERFENDLRAHGLPVRAFSHLMWRESRCRPRVIGWNYYKGSSHRDCVMSSNHEYKKCSAVRSYDSGLMQINSTWVTVTAEVCGSVRGDLSVLKKKNCNLRVAKYLFERGGFHHWK